ncbi:hypothetical protein JOB18_041708 [Solea senegalensis]|uniref:Uncharacterized protein n=1 Tax=Solea senegalensis TaxID=28829 RepID=A0AAV6TAK0_SOLSE|nr:hypothetical protein JOB18_041708 [Solea senegalensis]
MGLDGKHADTDCNTKGMNEIGNLLWVVFSAITELEAYQSAMMIFQHCSSSSSLFPPFPSLSPLEVSEWPSFSAPGGPQPATCVVFVALSTVSGQALWGCQYSHRTVVGHKEQCLRLAAIFLHNWITADELDASGRTLLLF